MTSGSPTTAPVRQPTRWHGAWYFQPHGWRTFLLPRFVLPSRRQIPLTAAIHFGLGTAAMAMNTIRAPFAWRRRREPVNVLFVGRHHLGDFLMTLPAMRLARRGLPSARMTVVIQERYRHQLDLSELQLETIPEIEGLCFWSEVRAWRDRLREGRYDAVVFHRITRPDFPAILAAFLENVPHRVGGGDKGLQAFLTDVYCPDDREPVVTYHWNLVAAWLRLPHAAPELQWPDVVALPGVEKRWDLLIAPFAQHTKEWPVESWHALLRHALDQNLRVALSASPGESARAAALIAPFPA
ncbi:MAG: glycosyltransferase family 9 protein, partial [Chthoniobacterales bacterium]